MNAATLDHIADEVDRLPLPDRLWLLERLVRSLRRDTARRASDADLAAMAADPDIRRELAEIDREFPLAA